MSDIVLTKVSMSLTESALAEDWEGEDDEYWESYLIDPKSSITPNDFTNFKNKFMPIL
jgi:hypothetical protein